MIGRTNAGGGGLKLYVLGGTTEPASPAENTIWVNTANTITDWFIQYDEPESPAEGTLWISSSAKANTKVNVLWMHGLTFGFGTPKQYISGAWVTKTAKIRINGAWVDAQTFVYKDGDYNENYAESAQKSSSWMSVTITEEDADIKIDDSVSGQVHSYGFVYFNRKIDLTEVKTIKYTYSSYGMGNNTSISHGYRFVATTGNGENQWSSPTAGTPQAYDNYSQSTPNSVELDVSGLSGEHYVGVALYSYGGNSGLRIHSVELIL